MAKERPKFKQGFGITIAAPDIDGSIQQIREVEGVQLAHVSGKQDPHQIIVSVGDNTVTLTVDASAGVLRVTRSTLELAHHQILGEFDL